MILMDKADGRNLYDYTKEEKEHGVLWKLSARPH